MNQTAGKLIVGWLNDVGIKVKYEVVDAGTLINYQYEYTGDTYTPNWDLFIWYWTQDVDPNFIVDIYTPQQIEGWNDCLWTDPEYTELNEQQKRTIDPAARIPLIQRMQQIFYEGAPYAVLAYPYLLEAYNTADWEGWTPVPGQAIGEQNGAVLYSFNNIDTYRLVQPKVAVEPAAGGSSSTTLVIVVVVAAVLIVVALLLMRRRGGKAVEET
jgi:hypothetical protein